MARVVIDRATGDVWMWWNPRTGWHRITPPHRVLYDPWTGRASVVTYR